VSASSHDANGGTYLMSVYNVIPPTSEYSEEIRMYFLRLEI
jgi:hypothetical protein